MPRITRANIATLAEADGCKVERTDAFTRMTRNRNRIVLLWQDGSIVRGDVDLTVAREMSVGEAADVLQLL